MNTSDRLAACANIEEARGRGHRIVFTNGCFDLLHAGHCHLLVEAKALGDFLVVAINSDESVKRLKGEGRPFFNEQERAFVLSCLEAVDLVTVFWEDTPLELIEAIRPDILVKGGEYGPGQVVGEDEMKAWGGRVERIPMRQGFSTTATSQRWYQWYNHFKRAQEEET